MSSLWVELAAVVILFTVTGLNAQPQPLSGSYVINGSSNFSAKQFATIQEAFDSLVSRGAAAPGVTFSVESGYDPANEPANGLSLTTYTTNPNAPVLLTFTNYPGTVTIARNFATAKRFLLLFRGSINYFTLNGAGKLILQSQATGGTNTGVIGFVSSAGFPALDLQAVHIDSVIIQGKSSTDTYTGIFIGDSASLTSAVSTGSTIGTPRGLTFSHCQIDSVSRPILIRGHRSNTQNITIVYNTIGDLTATDWAPTSSGGGIHVLGAVNVKINKNIVRNSNPTSYQIAGIRLDSCESATVARNWIYGIRYTGTGGWGNYGIAVNVPTSFISPSPTVRIHNNMIADIYADGFGTSGLYWISGIYVTASSSVSDARLEIFHNSIRLEGNNPATNYTGVSSGITFNSNIGGGVTINGNLIQNRLKPGAGSSGTPTAYGIAILTSSPSSWSIDYNLYHVQAFGANNVIGRVGSGDYITITSWQGGPITPDANGNVHLPGAIPFLSTIDLHLDPSSQSNAINGGSNVFNGTQDFDLEIRPLPNPGPGASGDPGTSPDIGADELDGTPFSCPTALVAPNLSTSTSPFFGSAYGWGQMVALDTAGTNSPTASGSLSLIYSLDGGLTWTAGPAVGSFPVNYTLPLSGDSILLSIVADNVAGCPALTPDTSDIPLKLYLSDRPGNRAQNAISVTLTQSGNLWTATIQDSTNGPGTTNEFNPGAPHNAQKGQNSPDLFFMLILPTCFDSLHVSLCSPNTNFDTYLHLINHSDQDTISNDDAGSARCSSSTSSIIYAIGAANTNKFFHSNGPATRDSMRLKQNDTLYVVVEGYSSNQGTFELTITGYAPAPPTPTITGAPTGPICVKSSPITLDGTTPGAAGYQWYVNGNPITGATNPTYTYNPTAVVSGENLAVKVIFPSPNGLTCNDTVQSAPVTIIVEDSARADIGNGTNTVTGQTLSFSAGANVSFVALTNQTLTHSWALYNGNPPSGAPTQSGSGSTFAINNIAAGQYTVLLVSTYGTGACGNDSDYVYLNVTTPTSLSARPSSAFSLYPNPTTGTFTISTTHADRYTVELLDVAGHLVARENFEGTAKTLHVSLPAGVYQVRLISGSGTQFGRLIISE